MTPEEFTAARRQNVKLPGGMEFAIRRIGGIDFLAMGGSCDLRQFIGKPKHEVLKAVGKHLEDLFDSVLKTLSAERGFLEKIVVAGAASPKVVRELGIKGTVCVDDLLQEELDMLAGAILSFSFLTKEEAQRIGPLSETENSSSISTPSGGDTENSQAKSFPSNGSPQPTPSTSHVPAQESPKKTQPASAESGRAEGGNVG